MIRSFLTFALLPLCVTCPETRAETQIEPARAGQPSRPLDGPSKDAGRPAAIDAGVAVPALPAPLTDAELAAWLAQHQVRSAFRGHQCIRVRIGIPAADGLLCTEPLRGLYKQGSEAWKMWRSDKRRLSLVWSGRRNWDGQVDLRIEIAPGGDSFVLRENTPGACDLIYDQAYEKEEFGDWRKTESIQSFCLQRGRYVWTGKRFRLDPRQCYRPPVAPGRWLWAPCPE